MTAIIKNKFRLQNARDFLENFSSSAHSSSRNHYLFVGKPTVWGTGAQSSELSPPAPLDTQESEVRIWEEMIGLKRIDSVNTSLVIPRSDWSGGTTVYAIYDDRDAYLSDQPTQARITALSSSGLLAGNFYVMTDAYDIFVCLENGSNSVSAEKPVKLNPASTLIDYRAIDGYVWKYVASVSASDATRFLTDSWLPVKTLATDDGGSQWVSQSAATPGELVSVVVENGGTGYIKTYSGTVTTISNSGGKGYAILTTGSPSGVDDFYNNGQIHITSGTGINETYIIEDYIGGTKQIVVSTPFSSGVTSGNSCQILPRLTISTSGTEVKVRPIVDAFGVITKVLPITRGANSTSLTITVENSLGGSGAIVRPILSDYVGLGKDVEKDLNASFVMLNVKLQFDEGSGDFVKDNDYRQLGIVRDVKNLDGTLATATTRIATKTLNLTGVTNSSTLTYDEVFRVSLSIQAIALDYTKTSAEGVLPETGVLTYIQTPATGYGTFTNGASISGTQSAFGAQITPTNGVVSEEIKKGAGHVLYIENRRAILRSPDQIEDIKAIIEF